jgi:hypothetical protein
MSEAARKSLRRHLRRGGWAVVADHLAKYREAPEVPELRYGDATFTFVETSFSTLRKTTSVAASARTAPNIRL